MNQNDKNKLEKFGMTHNQIVELKAFLVERYVDNMSTKDLVTMSCIPRTSQTALVAPPAIMPVPVGAALINIFPDPLFAKTS